MSGDPTKAKHIVETLLETDGVNNAGPTPAHERKKIDYGDRLRRLRARRGETTLAELFRNSEPDQAVLDQIPTAWLDVAVPAREMPASEAGDLLTMQGYPIREARKIALEGPTRKVVKGYANQIKSDGYLGVDPILVDKNQGRVYDGHHRALAAFLCGSPIRYVDLAEVESIVTRK